jgi:hypothetical protein
MLMRTQANLQDIRKHLLCADTATPLAKRSSDNDSTAHTPSTKFSSVYLPIGAPEIDVSTHAVTCLRDAHLCAFARACI